MKLIISFKRVLVLSLVISTSGCATLDLQPWSTGDIVDGVITSIVSGKPTSYGNKATCNQYKMIGGSTYREWKKDGKIACSYEE
jgi:hypothetical protein